jgi:hypothetical protein
MGTGGHRGRFPTSVVFKKIMHSDVLCISVLHKSMCENMIC